MTNINAEQSNLFPVVILGGVSHWGFASGDVPSTVLNNDLTLEVTEDVAHLMVASNVLQFVHSILNDGRSTNAQDVFHIDAFTAEFVTPLLNAMAQEG